MDSCYPLVTLTSMIAPSPDWFVGVHDYPLYKNGQWVNHVVVQLYPWDAGTDDGATFSTANITSTPPLPIYPIGISPYSSLGGKRVAPIASFTFERIGSTPYQATGDLNNDGLVDFNDLAILASSWLTDCNVPPYSNNCLFY